MSRRVAGATVGLFVIGVLAGCTGGGQEPVGLSTVTASPSQEVEPTPTPTPTPTSILGRVQDMSDPELGIVFDDVPDLAGDEADVHNWIATFEQEYWRTLITNTVSPAFDVFTSPEIQARMAEIAANNTADQSLWGGVFHVRIADIVVDGDTATGTTCDDYRQVTLEEPGGPVSVEARGDDVPIFIRVHLVRNPIGEGLWTIQSNEGLGGC
jgi:hypothetical protein